MVEDSEDALSRTPHSPLILHMRWQGELEAPLLAHPLAFSAMQAVVTGLGVSGPAK
jgi:hypothetical protein